jgi:hypothetical protein
MFMIAQELKLLLPILAFFLKIGARPSNQGVSGTAIYQEHSSFAEPRIPGCNAAVGDTRKLLVVSLPFDGVGFLDFGNVHLKFAPSTPLPVRKSAGPGLHVGTPFFLLNGLRPQTRSQAKRETRRVLLQHRPGILTPDPFTKLTIVRTKRRIVAVAY